MGRPQIHVDLTASDVVTTGEELPRAGVRLAIADFVRSGAADKALQLLQCLKQEDLAPHAHLLPRIVESAASLITSASVGDAVAGLALILHVQVRGFAKDYLELSTASFTVVCVLSTRDLAAHPCFAEVAGAMAQTATAARGVHPEILRDAPVWINSLVSVEDANPHTTKVVAEFVAQLGTPRDVLCAWWSSKPQPFITERVVLAVLNQVARARDRAAVVATAKSIGQQILDGFDVHKVLPKQELLRFCYCLGQAVQSPEWPTGEVFLTYFIHLIVRRMAQTVARSGANANANATTNAGATTNANASAHAVTNDFVEAGFAMFYEWQDLLNKLLVSLERECVEQSTHGVRDRMLQLLTTRAPAAPTAVTPSAQQQYLGLVLCVPPSSTRYAPPNEWLSLLSRCDLATYYDHMRELAYACARSPDVSESCLATLYTFMHRPVSDDPMSFDAAWVHRTRGVRNEDALLAFTLLASIHVQTAANLQLVQQLLARLQDPGFVRLKLALVELLRTYLHPAGHTALPATANVSHAAAWKYLFVGATSSTSAVRAAATSACIACIGEGENWQTVAELATAPETGALTATVIKQMVLGLNNEPEPTAGLRRVVAVLLSNGDVDTAAEIVAHNGRLMPLRWLHAAVPRALMKSYLRLLTVALRDVSSLYFPPSEIDRVLDLVIAMAGNADLELHQLAGAALRDVLAYPDAAQSRRYARVRLGLEVSCRRRSARAVRVLGYIGGLPVPECLAYAGLEALADREGPEAALSTLEIVAHFPGRSVDCRGISLHVLWCAYARIRSAEAQTRFLEAVRGLPLLRTDLDERDTLAGLQLVTAAVQHGVLPPDRAAAVLPLCVSPRRAQAELAMQAFDAAVAKYPELIVPRVVPALAAADLTPAAEAVVLRIWDRAASTPALGRRLIVDAADYLLTLGPKPLAKWLGTLSRLPLRPAEQKLLREKVVLRLRVRPTTDHAAVPYALVRVFQAWLEFGGSQPFYPLGLADRLLAHPEEVRRLIFC